MTAGEVVVVAVVVAVVVVVVAHCSGVCVLFDSTVASTVEESRDQRGVFVSGAHRVRFGGRGQYCCWDSRCITIVACTRACGRVVL